MLHIWHNIFSFVSLLPLDCSWQLYTLIPVATRNVLSLVGTVYSNITLSVYPLWVQKFLVIFLVRINPLYLVSWFYRVFFILSKIPSITIHHLSPARWYTFDNIHILEIHQSPNCMRVSNSRGWTNERIHCKVRVSDMLILFANLGWMVRNHGSMQFIYKLENNNKRNNNDNKKSKDLSWQKKTKDLHFLFLSMF